MSVSSIFLWLKTYMPGCSTTSCECGMVWWSAVFFFRPRAHFTCGNIFSFHNWGSLTPWYFNLSDSSGALLPLTVKWNVALQLLHFHRGHKASIFRNSFNPYQVQFHTNWHWPCQLRWSQSAVLTNNSTVHTSVLLKCQSVWKVTALIHFNLQVTLAVGYTAILWQNKDILLKNKTKTCWHFNSFRNITSTNQHSCLHNSNLFVTTGRWGKLVPLHKQPHTLSSWRLSGPREASLLKWQKKKKMELWLQGGCMIYSSATAPLYL